MNGWQRALAMMLTATLIAAAVSICSVGGGAAQRAEGSTKHRAKHRTKHRASITQGLDCSTCHAETGWDTLGNSAGGGFDHGRTGFPLGGQHTRASCSDCHSAGAPISRQCGSCHQDPHERRLGQDCADCHSAVSFGVNRAMQRHRATRLPLSGMHALLDCTECHRRSTERRFSSLPTGCIACHARDYRRSDIHPLHVGVAGDPARPPLPTDCAQCHRATGWSPAVVDPTQLRLSLASAALTAPTAPPGHDLVFPIGRGSHRSAQCEDCHADVARPSRVQCTGCHAHGPTALRKQHRGKPVGRRARACLSCHPGGVVR